MKLSEIQQTLKAPKNQFNKFGGYKYRNCEDILEAVKPLLGSSILLLDDRITESAGRVYVRATATFWEDGDREKAPVEVSAYAREEETKKGMDAAQITGSASSYARKYALNGLFLIDDAKDPDNEVQTAESSPPKVVNFKVVAPPPPDYRREPHKIDYGSDYVNFGKLFVGAIAEAKNDLEISLWERTNKETIAEILTKSPKIGDAIKNRISENYDRVRTNSKEG